MRRRGAIGIVTGAAVLAVAGWWVRPTPLTDQLPSSTPPVQEVSTPAAPLPAASPTDQPAARTTTSTSGWLTDPVTERVRMLLASLDLNRPGLEQVRSARENEDWQGACDGLLEYFRTCHSGEWLRGADRPTGAAGRSFSRADNVLADTVFVGWINGRLPRRADNGFDWTCGGPANDPSWAALLNYLTYLRAPMRAYRISGDKKYARCIDEHVRDWILSNPYPAHATRDPHWNGLGVATRARLFGEIFYGLQHADAFTPATRVLLLASLVEHGDYLRRFHADTGNWVANEMGGLAALAASFPEFQLSGEWTDYATSVMLQQIDQQVYPDGAQIELAASYHRITATHFQEFIETLARVGRHPASFHAGLESMWDYLAFTMRPSGYGPINNDSSEDFMRQYVQGVAPSYGRDDWIYIATNGAEGLIPRRGPSVLFPWAGHAVMRSGWGADALWSFFDIGPFGQAHQHHDMLHLSVSAFGRDLLVDSGTFRYKGDAWRAYFRGSSAHNVILVDGRGQKRYREIAEAPVADWQWQTGELFDYAVGTFDAGFDGVRGRAVHTRAVMHVRGRFWVVVDRIDTDRPRDVSALWHFQPDCHVILDGDQAVSGDPSAANLRIIPVGDVPWAPVLVRAEEEPIIQGWFSPKANHRVPATCADYRGRIEQSRSFAWVLIPAPPGRAPSATVSEAQFDGDGSRLRVTVGTETWRLAIPLQDSSEPDAIPGG